ncbi:MAG: imidazolonepropionase [Polyangiaceae bacterium]|nr:imidazolonepropionase [Polyangiaceae bacterium]
MSSANAADTVVCAKRLVTCVPGAKASNPLGVIEDAFVRLRAGRIAAVGLRRDLDDASLAGATIFESELVTPGLVDAHTHAAWFGSRHEEYALRMAGADYETIAKHGGGIVSTMRAVRGASQEAIAASLERRLARMVAQGITTVEVKSGYGLDLESERKQLRAMRDASASARAPRVVPTYLALHALPPEAAGDRRGYATRVADREFEELAAERLFSFVDAYIERSAFSVDDARPLLEKARKRGFGVRLHVGQFADVGGAELAAELGAKSVDHLENVGDEGRAALANAGVRAILLPVASFTLAQQPPDVEALRRAGIGLVVASDANPGTAPTESLPLALAMAVRSYGLTVAETILGATREAARSLGLDDTGVIAPGAAADLVLWDLPHEAAIVQPQGVPRAERVIRRGESIFVAR